MIILQDTAAADVTLAAVVPSSILDSCGNADVGNVEFLMLDLNGTAPLWMRRYARVFSASLFESQLESRYGRRGEDKAQIFRFCAERMDDWDVKASHGLRGFYRAHSMPGDRR
jgi:hypothetical protein